MKLLDTNLILRFLLKDDLNQFKSAEAVFGNPEENLYLSELIVAEVIWVLTSFYEFSKEKAGEKIYYLLKLPTIETNRPLLMRTLYFFNNFNIAFIDAYLAAYCEQNKLEGIYSFDKDLDKIKSVKRFEPK